VIFLAGVFICVGYPVLLYYYFITTGFVWSLSTWYAIGYYLMIITAEALLIYTYIRVEQSEKRLEVDLDRKVRELTDSENQQRDAVE